MGRLRTFLAAHSRVLFVAFLLLSMAAIVGWSFPFERTFVYRYRHGLGVGLGSATVNFVRGGEPVRAATFIYSRGPDRGPVSQDHAVRLAPGAYDAVFVLEFHDGGRKELAVPVTVRRFTRAYTLDIYDKGR